jgi:hypothetical protein
LPINLFSLTQALAKGWQLGSKGCYIALTKQTPLTTGHVVFDTVLPTVTGYLMTATMVPIEPTPTELMFDMLHTASREAYIPFTKPSNLLVDTTVKHMNTPFKTIHHNSHDDFQPKPYQRKPKPQTRRPRKRILAIYIQKFVHHLQTKM